MPRKFLTSIDLNKNQLLQARLENLATAPSAPVVGQMYWDTSLGHARKWDGVVWQRSSFANDPYNRDFHTGTQLAATISNFNTAVRTNTLNQMAAPTADLNIGFKLTGVTPGTAPNDAVVRSQLDAISAGLDIKASVRAASIGAIAVTYNAAGGTSSRGQITAAPNAVDGVPLAVNDRVLLKDQAAGAQNGFWVVTTVGTGSTGVWDRAPDFDSDSEVTGGAFTFVEEGSINADTGWVLATNNPIVIGGAAGTSLTFAQFSGAGQLIAGAALVKTGNQFDVVAAPGGGISVAADSISVDTAIVVRKYSASFGDGAALVYVITHNLATADVTVAVYDNTSPFAELMCDVEHTSANTVTLRFAIAPTSNQYRIVVHG